MVCVQIMVQTAKFVRESGGHSELVLRVRQAANPNFAFLRPDDPRHAYFRWLVTADPQVLDSCCQEAVCMYQPEEAVESSFEPLQESFRSSSGAKCME